MKKQSFCMLWILLTAMMIGVIPARAQSTRDYDSAYIGAPLRDAVMQHNKETFVLYGCAYCHGLYLKPVGEARDLRKSAYVAADKDGNLIGAILRAGIPKTSKYSPMPQFSDLSDQEIRAIASYVHYTRARENFKVLTNESSSGGNAGTGKAYFEKNCSSCHSSGKGLAGISNKYGSSELREQMLDPAVFRTPKSFKLSDLNSDSNAGRASHQALLENFSKADVSNLLAYLRTLK